MVSGSMACVMVMESRHGPTEIVMSVSGGEALHAVLVQNNMLTVASTMVWWLMIGPMDEALTSTQAEHNTQVNGKMTRCTEKDMKYGLMAPIIRVSTLKIISTAKESLLMQIALATKASLKWMRYMGWVITSGPMERGTLAIGLRARCTVKAH